MTDMLPTLARIYGLTPADVWALSEVELATFLEDLEALNAS